MSSIDQQNTLPPLADAAPKQRNWFARHKIATGVLAFVAVAVIATAAGGGSSSDTTEQAAGSTQQEQPKAADKAGEEPAAPPAEAVEPVEPEFTAAQENAISQAESYLEFGAFSKSGLIGQLEFEDYATKDATFAVEYLDVDWREQAVKKAESYLETSSFSQSGLVDQLEFEGFTSAQARHGAAQAYK